MFVYLLLLITCWNSTSDFHRPTPQRVAYLLYSSMLNHSNIVHPNPLYSPIHKISLLPLELLYLPIITSILKYAHARLYTHVQQVRTFSPKNAHTQVYIQDMHAQNKQNGVHRTSVFVCVRLMSWCQCCVKVLTAKLISSLQLLILMLLTCLCLVSVCMLMLYANTSTSTFDLANGHLWYFCL